MATDAQSLLSTVAHYCATGNVTGVSLLRLALLKQIAHALNPMADTTVQGLLSQTNLPGWAATSNASLSDLLELALLNLIAGAVAGGSGGGIPQIISGNYGGVQPTPTPSGPAIFYDTSGGQVWIYDGTTWNEAIA